MALKIQNWNEGLWVSFDVANRTEELSAICVFKRENGISKIVHSEHLRPNDTQRKRNKDVNDRLKELEKIYNNDESN